MATIAVGFHQKVFELTRKKMEKYARKIEAELIVVEETDHEVPHFAKFDLIARLADEGWDKALFVDADVHIRGHSPNIFDYYKVAAFSEVPHPRPEWLHKSIDWIRDTLVPDWPADRYFNTGVLVFDRQSLEMLARYVRDATPMPGQFFEQDQLNVLMAEAGFPQERLEQRWNQFCGPRWLTNVKAAESYFLHGNGLGHAKDKLEPMAKLIARYP